MTTKITKAEVDAFLEEHPEISAIDMMIPDAAGVLRTQKPGTTVPYLIKRGDQHLQLNVPLTSTRANLADYFVNLALALVY